MTTIHKVNPDNSTGTNELIALGDINGDFLQDFAIGYFTSTGSAYSIYLGSIESWASEITSLEASFSIKGLGNDARLVGADVDGDGFSDLTITNGADFQQIMGHFDVDTPFEDVQFEANSDENPFTDSTAVWRVLSGGDFDGDGKDDVVEMLSSGGINIISGDTSEVLSIEGDGQVYYSADFGADLNSDGKSDLVFSYVDADNYDMAFVLYGNAFADAPSSVSVSQLADNIGVDQLVAIADTNTGSIGRYVSFADFDGDGQSDILVGTPDKSGIQNNSMIEVILAPQVEDETVAIFDPESFVIFNNEANAPIIGGQLSTLGDVNHDGRDDVGFVVEKYLSTAAVAPDTYSATIGMGLNSSSNVNFDTEGNGDLEAYHFLGADIAFADTQFVALGDINGDAIDDFAIYNQSEISGYIVLGGDFATLDDATSPAGDHEIGTAAASQSAAVEFKAGTTIYATNQAKLGASVAGGYDANGDGIMDLLLGAYENSTDTAARTLSGSVFLMLGNPVGGASDINISDDVFDPGIVEFIGANSDDQIGNSVSFISDLNGDGFDEILFTSANSDGGAADGGSAYLVMGRENWASKIDLASDDEIVQLDGTIANSSMQSITDLGDLNGDGIADFAIGLPGARYADEDGVDVTGEVVILSGADLTEIATIAGQNSGGLGSTIANLGDVNGDGINEFAIGSFDSDSIIVFDSETNNLQDWTEAGARVGRAIAGGGDYNADGYIDVVVSYETTETSDAGVKIFWGDEEGYSFENTSFINAPTATDGFGWSLVNAGDVDGDFIDDLLIGANVAQNNAGESAGAAFLVLGSETLSDEADYGLEDLSDGLYSFYGTQAGDSAGSTLVALGDINQDGYADLGIGAEGYQSGTDAGNNAGAFFTVLGGRDNLDALVGTSGEDGIALDQVSDANFVETRSIETFYGDLVGSITEDGLGSVANATGTLDVKDRDRDQMPSVETRTIEGTYGTLIYDPETSEWIYTRTNDAAKLATLNALNGAKDGNPADTLTDIFSVKSSLGATQNLLITISGLDDAPVVSGTLVKALGEDGGSTSGTIAISDVDSNDNPAFANTSLTGTYGALELTDGAWVYTANDSVHALNAGEAFTESFALKATDGTAATIKVNLTGANDASVVSGVFSALIGEDNPAAKTGTLSIADVDTNDAPSFSDTTMQGQYGSITLMGEQWSYALDDRAQALNVDDRVQDSFLFTASDGTEKTIVVNVHGRDDASVITGPSHVDMNEDAAFVTRTVSISDIDSLDTPTFSATTLTGVYGALVFDGKIWTYTPNDSVDTLNEGEKFTENFTLTASDGNAIDLKVNLTGADDASVVSGDLTAQLREDDGQIGGQIKISDIDDDDNPLFEDKSIKGTYGTLAILASQWLYSTSALAQTLDAQMEFVEYFSLIATDGTEQGITVTITGDDDLPVIDGTTQFATPNDLQSISGGIKVTDIDSSDSPVLKGTYGGMYGTLNIDSETGTWSYERNDVEIPEGAEVVETINVPTQSKDTSFDFVFSFSEDAELTGDGSGGDQIILGAGSSVVNGLGGNDYIWSGAGSDTVDGGEGNDEIVDIDGDDVIGGGAGNDKIIALEGQNQIDGGAGSDIIRAGGGDDMVQGGSGNDRISADPLRGMHFGNDTIEGGAGDDLLMARFGQDVFVFNSGDGNDTIAKFDPKTGELLGTDFSVGIDKIQLKGFTDLDASNLFEHIADVSGNAVLTDEEISITLYGVTTEQLSIDDFVFV